MCKLQVTRIIFVSMLGLAILSGGTWARSDSPRQEIEAWNQKYIAAHLRMDNAAILAMWQEDGVSLLQGMDPIQGKADIGKFFGAPG